MLTVAYCRVSTEEQAAEGFSIEGQAERLRSYAELHELGPVTVITDPGWSGKNLKRPGLQELLAMVDKKHVTHVLVWRLDRLSRDLGDLLLLADTFGNKDVALHSFSERIDLSSATGRMFYSVLGAFAQFYREQLAENVRMGQAQAVREGKWVNRPKTGYDLVDGELVPNEMAPVIRQIFRMRGSGASQGEIARVSGVKYSTVQSILHSRIYVGEVQLNGEWFAGHHESIVSEAEWQAAHRGRVPGRRRGRHILSGRVRCGLCGRGMTKEDNGSGHAHYRCRHRGQGCALPRRSARGLLRAAVLGMQLVGSDERLQDAIREELGGSRQTVARDRSRGLPGPTGVLAALIEDRRKLLRLHYDGQVGAALFAEEESRLSSHIDALTAEARATQNAVEQSDALCERFEEVSAYLRDLDIGRLWAQATEDEQRVLVDELVESVAVHPDHLEVTLRGAPTLNVELNEVGLNNASVDCSCRRGDLNPHAPKGTSPSSWRVCRFRHFDVEQRL